MAQVPFELPSPVTDLTVVDTLQVDGYVIDPSNAVAGAVLRYNSTKFVASLLTANVDSVTCNDSSLTISPNTGAVIANLNTAHANTFTALQTFSPHIVVDGYTINPTSALSNQALVLSGTSFIAQSVVNSIAVDASGIHTTAATGALTLSLSAIPNSSLANSTIGITNSGGLSVSGSPVSLGSSFTIGLPPTGTAGTYTTATGDSFVFDGYGRETSVSVVTRNINTAARLTGGGNLTADRLLDLAAFGSAGTYTTATGDQFIFDAYGRESSVSTTTRNVNTISAQLVGGGALSSDLNLGLASIVTPGTHSFATGDQVTLDAYGRTTLINTFVRTIATAARLTGGGNLSSDRLIDLAAFGTAGTINIGNGNIVFDGYGRESSWTTPTNLITSAGGSANQVAYFNGSVTITSNANLTYDGYTEQVKHLGGVAGTPGIAAGPGLGTLGSPSASIVGNDLTGTITLVSGALNTGTANAIAATITFNRAFASPPVIILVPGSVATDQYVVQIGLTQANVTTTTFFIETGAVNIPTAATLVFNYMIIGA